MTHSSAKVSFCEYELNSFGLVLEPPSAVAELTVVRVTSDSMTLTWTLTEDGNSPVTDYIVYYSSGVLPVHCLPLYYVDIHVQYI